MSEPGKAVFLSYASPCFAKASQGVAGRLVNGGDVG